jgi:hypothetical protein
VALLTYGSFHFTTAATTSLSSATPAKAAGTTTAGLLGGFTMPTNNRLTYGDSTTRVFSVRVSLSMTRSSGGGPNVSVMVAKNGTVIPYSQNTQEIATTTDQVNIASCITVELAEDDYVEAWIETNNGVDIDVEHGCLIARVLG